MPDDAGELESAQTVSEDPPTPQAAPLPDLGPAPELENEVWLNVDAPLRLADLRGRVVLLDMWTFGCVNCQHVIPSLREWHYQYGPQGLVVIGNHYPEFEFERDLGNLEEALVRLDVPYAVAQDNDRVTWAAYDNRYWPTLYLIDKRGHIRYTHIGEGNYAETEAAIAALLAEPYP
jgi:thiol-disulfide isomerase/thioredoxin